MTIRAIAVFILMLPGWLFAAPWLAVGDSRLRADVELLAAHGLITNLTTTWPIGSGQLTLLRSNAERIARSAPAVQAAARRVLAAIKPAPSATIQLKLTDDPAIIRGFGSRARQQGDAQLTLTKSLGPWDVDLRGGVQSGLANTKGARFAADGTVLSFTKGNWRFFAGWPEAWYGAGQITALSLSNNARPFPKIGFIRDNPVAFESPWLSWLGPWRVDYFAGLLDGERIQTETYFSSLRVAINPVEGFELGLARTTQLCGKTQRCNLYRALINFNNSDDSINITNDEGLIDLRYTKAIGNVVVSPYLQHMNDDTGPFEHSYSNHLLGMTVDVWGDSASRVRLMVEFADTRATLNAFDFSTRLPGLAYNNFSYVDGFRYRGRTIGASLDSDSKLLTLAASYVRPDGAELGLALHHAQISSQALADLQAAGRPYINTLSATPEKFNEADLSLRTPLPALAVGAELGLELRARDARVADQGRFNAELSLRYAF